MRKFLLATAIGAVMAPGILHANELPDVDADAEGTHWSGNGELGLALSRGNTDSQTLLGRLSLAREDERWKHEAGLAFQYGQQDDIDSAYRYEAFGKTGLRLGERSRLSGSARTERDHFAAYEYQSTAAFSYGHDAVKTEATHLDFEIGPGYRWSKLQGVRVHENGGVVRGLMDFGHRFNDSTSVYDTLLVEAGRDNTFARNEAGVQVRMSDALALKAGVEVRHNTDVLPGIHRTDTLTTVNVSYGF
ncbi:DUF481 domain-containing protein [Lysobacter sp. F60174L2]|uniref:DUF481 domain-containing protein n=1 Tax=Lysobacter sp. F60174L2 TaxID=3459295 RepID=UPI00403DCB81